MKKIISAVVLVIVLFASGLIVGRKTKSPDIIERVDIDTLYIPAQAKIIYKRATLTKVERDTTVITLHDTIRIKESVKVAEADTTFEEGYLRVRYIFPPVNIFRFYWKPNPKEIIRITETVTVKPKWYDNFYVGVGIDQRGKFCINLSYGLSLSNLVR